MPTYQVSILLAVYNAGRYLRATLDSVIAQANSGIECICIDDHSTDNSLDICQEYELKYPRIFRYSMNDRKGACAARNKAFELSNGAYIQYLDADDLLAPGKIASQLKLFERYGDDMVVSGCWDRFHSDPQEAQFPQRFLDKDWVNPVDWLVNSWEGRGMGQTSIWLTPRKLIEKAGPWNEGLSINQDGEFFNRVLLQAAEIKHCPEARVYYRSGNPESISRKPGRSKAESLLLSYQLYVQNTLPLIDNEHVRHALMMNFLNFIYLHYQFRDLAVIAKKEIVALGFSSLEVTGGSTFRRIASFIGFENALKLREIMAKLYKS